MWQIFVIFLVLGVMGSFQKSFSSFSPGKDFQKLYKGVLAHRKKQGQFEKERLRGIQSYKKRKQKQENQLQKFQGKYIRKRRERKAVDEEAYLRKVLEKRRKERQKKRLLYIQKRNQVQKKEKKWKALFQDLEGF